MNRSMKSKASARRSPGAAEWAALLILAACIPQSARAADPAMHCSNTWTPGTITFDISLPRPPGGVCSFGVTLPACPPGTPNCANWKANKIAAACNLPNKCGGTVTANVVGGVVTFNSNAGVQAALPFKVKDNTGEVDSTGAALTGSRTKGEEYKLKANASGISWDGTSPGSVYIGTDAYVSRIFTSHGETPDQIVSHAMSDLAAHGVTNVMPVKTEKNEAGFYFPQSNRDGLVVYGADDSGASPEFDVLPDSVGLSVSEGETQTIFAPPGTPTLAFHVDPGFTHSFRTLTLYGYDPAQNAWGELALWTTDQAPADFYYNPDPSRNGYQLVYAGDSAPLTGVVTYPGVYIQASPSPIPGVPNYSIGWMDASSGEFSKTLGQGGGSPAPFTVQPGLSLEAVPHSIGANHWQYIQAQFNLQRDPTRPWLYLNGDPNQPFAGNTLLLLHASGIYDPNGVPVNGLPLQIIFQQVGAPRMLQTSAYYDPSGNLVIPSLDLGPLLAQPFTLTIGVPGGSALSGVGYFDLDSANIVHYPIGTAGAPDAGPVSTEFRLQPPTPNPARSATALRFETKSRERVLVEVLDVSGRIVRTLLNAEVDPGTHSMPWDGQDGDGRHVPSGIYYVRARAGASILSQKITLTR